MSDLKERAAKALGWSVADANSLSMQAIRAMVHQCANRPDLVAELDQAIRSGSYIRGGPLKKPRRGHATIGATKIWQRDVSTAPKATKPFKVVWKLLRPHVRLDEVEEWLEIYRKDHPGVEFVASDTKPRAK